MVTGNYAFPASTLEELFQMQNRGFRRINWPVDVTISDDCKELICLMLKQKPSQRIQIQDILNHRFITQFQKETEPKQSIIQIDKAQILDEMKQENEKVLNQLVHLKKITLDVIEERTVESTQGSTIKSKNNIQQQPLQLDPQAQLDFLLMNQEKLQFLNQKYKNQKSNIFKETNFLEKSQIASDRTKEENSIIEQNQLIREQISKQIIQTSRRFNQTNNNLNLQESLRILSPSQDELEIQKMLDQMEISHAFIEVFHEDVSAQNLQISSAQSTEVSSFFDFTLTDPSFETANSLSNHNSETEETKAQDLQKSQEQPYKFEKN